MKIFLSLISLSIFSGLGALGINSKFYESLEFAALEKISASGSTSYLPADGRITGTVIFSKAAASSNRSSKGLYGKTTSRLSSGGAGDKRAVVYIAKAAGYFTASQTRPAMRQKNVAIVPRVLPVVAGTTVDFPNEDDIYHNIFSLSPNGQFDLGRYAKGISKSVKFSTVGQVKVFCDIHSSMGGVILVLQNPFYTLTNADGSYSLAGVPAGNYDLVAWQETSGTQTMKIKVSGGEIVTQNFSF